MAGDGDGGNPHVEQSVPRDWEAFEWTDGHFVAYDVPEWPGVELYSVSAVTPDVRSLALGDAVLYQGNLLRPQWHEALRVVRFCHDYAGKMGERPVADILDDPAIRLSRVDRADFSEVFSSGE